MFGVKIEGRLGNQLFQYAFALARQQRLHEDFYLDCYKYGYADSYFVVPRYFEIATNIGTKNAWNKFNHRLSKPTQIIQDQWEDAATFYTGAMKPGALYRGYFQSEQYFLPVQDRVRQEFQVKADLRTDIRQITGNDKETIVVHIRRTDYLSWGNDELGYNLSLPDEYYQRCLSVLDSSDKNVLFISDDIPYVKSRFAKEGAFFSERNTEIADLQLLMQGDYLILSNSSFSWWGAWLNLKVKQVLAPKYWLGFKVGKEWPCGVIPERWQAIDVL